MRLRFGSDSKSSPRVAFVTGLGLCSLNQSSLIFGTDKADIYRRKCVPHGGLLLSQW